MQQESVGDPRDAAEVEVYAAVCEVRAVHRAVRHHHVVDRHVELGPSHGRSLLPLF